MRHRAWRWIGAIAGVAILMLIVERALHYRAQIPISWQQVSAPSIAAAFVVLALAQVVFAFSWHRLLVDQGAGGTALGHFSRWCVAIAGKYLPGKVWHGVARVGLYGDANARAIVAPAFLRELLLGMSAAMAMVALLGWREAGAPALLAPWTAVAAVALWLVATPAIGQRLAKLVGKFSSFALPGSGGSLRGLATAWLLQWIGYAVLGIGLIVLAHGLLRVPFALVLPVTAAFCFAGVAGIVAFFAPSGIGVREAALAWYLAPYIGPGPAALFAIAARLWLTLGDLLLIGLGMWLLQREAGKRSGSA